MASARRRTTYRLEPQRGGEHAVHRERVDLRHHRLGVRLLRLLRHVARALVRRDPSEDAAAAAAAAAAIAVLVLVAVLAERLARAHHAAAHARARAAAERRVLRHALGEHLQPRQLRDAREHLRPGLAQPVAVLQRSARMAIDARHEEKWE